MKLQKVIAPILVLLLAFGVALAIYKSNQQQRQEHAAKQVTAEHTLVTVKGLVGSEKQEYLTDSRVVDLLHKNGIDLQIETEGSREMAARNDLQSYDFGFPAGVPAGRKLMQVTHTRTSFTPFFTPMAVASWKQIADVLITNGIVKKNGASYYIVDMGRLLKTIEAGKRWNQLPNNNSYPVSKSILISSTDIRKSNSAAMYLALVSYLMNNGEVVQSQAQVQKILPEAASLFLRQGYQESSSAGPFEDYTSMGMGKAPLVMIYEAQYIEYQMNHQQNRNGAMVLLYPQPTVFTKHIFVPFNEKGSKLGALLQSNSDLQHLAVEHGLRISDADYTRQFWKKNGIQAPESLIDVIDPPSYEVLESMIQGIEQKLNQS